MERRMPVRSVGWRVRARVALAGLAVAFLVGAAPAAEPDFASIGAVPYAPPKPAPAFALPDLQGKTVDRKSTRLNSSHGYISYAVFCLKKKLQIPRSLPK